MGFEGCLGQELRDQLLADDLFQPPRARRDDLRLPFGRPYRRFAHGIGRNQAQAAHASGRAPQDLQRNRTTEPMPAERKTTRRHVQNHAGTLFDPLTQMDRPNHHSSVVREPVNLWRKKTRIAHHVR